MFSKFLANLIAKMPSGIVWIFSKKYIAGKSLDDAVVVSKNMNRKDIRVTLDVLGEYINKTSDAIYYRELYFETLDRIKSSGVDATVSVKPSMFGLLLDKEFCYQQIQLIVQRAHERKILVCLDMEDSSCTDDELEIFKRLYKEFPGTITIVLQAYLKRTIKDLKILKSLMLTDYPINVRICKGIYLEHESVAYTDKQKIRENYLLCTKYMMDNNFYAAIATHDTHIISGVNSYIESINLSKNRYEFQMLFGVRTDLRNKVLNDSHPMRLYVPFGKHWFGYSTRRLKENPKMLNHILKAIFVRG